MKDSVSSRQFAKKANTSNLADMNSDHSNILVAYFSWSGNTRGIAQQIQAMTRADLFEIKPVTPYSTDYNTVLGQARSERREQTRPELASQVENMDQYSKIILGYPNWWASIPMTITSFLESYDFTGKTIVPFCSHGGGCFGQSLAAIAKLVPNAKLAEALSVHYSGESDLPDEISSWLSHNGIIK